MELGGSVAIVTGGATGIGRAVCLDLARAGARGVVVNYSRSAAEAESTARDLAALGAEGLPVRADVADETQVKAMVDRAATISDASTSSSTMPAPPASSPSPNSMR